MYNTINNNLELDNNLIKISNKLNTIKSIPKFLLDRGLLDLTSFYIKSSTKKTVTQYNKYLEDINKINNLNSSNNEKIHMRSLLIIFLTIINN